jgi:hypothetical protein
VFAGDATFHLEGAGVHHHPHHSRGSSAAGYAPTGTRGYAPVGATVEFQRCVRASGYAQSVLRTVCWVQWFCARVCCVQCVTPSSTPR